MEWLGLSPVQLGATALLALFVVAILTGKLVPAKVADDRAAAAERDRDLWREAYVNEAAAHATSAGQTTELLQLARVTNALLAALPRTAEQIREDAG